MTTGLIGGAVGFARAATATSHIVPAELSGGQHQRKAQRLAHLENGQLSIQDRSSPVSS